MTSRRTVAVAVAAVVVALLAGGGVALLRRGPGGVPAAGPAAPATSPAPTSAPTPTSALAPSSGAAPSTTAPTTAPTTAAPTTARPSTGAPPTSPGTGVPAALRGRDVEVLPTSRHVVALTFDAGGDDAGLPAILRALAAADVHATFFATGRFAAAHPADVAAVVAAGHRVGDHSDTHPHLPALSDAAVRAEVLGGQRAVLAAGADPRPLFRFPFGDRDARTIALVNGLGYVPVRWTVDTLGWQGTAGGGSAQRVADRVLAALRPGEIVLMHVGANPDDSSTLDADALPAVLSRLQAAGYGFVTLDALLGQ